jgi:hypothetical protein
MAKWESSEEQLDYIVGCMPGIVSQLQQTQESREEETEDSKWK